MTKGTTFAMRFLGAPPSAEQVSRLKALWRRAESVLPGAPEDFFERLGQLANHDVAVAETLRVEELWLAFRCTRHDASAHVVLERDYLSKAAVVLHGMGDETFRDEVVQELRLSLLLEKSRLDRYEGRGSLLGWLRSACHRLGLTRLRLSKPHAHDSLEDHSPLVGGAEPLVMKQKDRELFAHAFRDALTSLDPQERAVLRLNLVEGLNIDLIGELYGVHRATAARWLARAKEGVSRRVREVMATQLSLGAREVTALMTSLGANLDVSVRRYLDES